MKPSSSTTETGDDNTDAHVPKVGDSSSVESWKSRGSGAPHGCRNGKYKHGMKGTPEWKAWVNARRRCADLGTEPKIRDVLVREATMQVSVTPM
jgi:hypothetical protein